MKRFICTCAVLTMTMIHPVFGQSPAAARMLMPEALQSKTGASTASAALQAGASGTWWRDPEWVKALNLTAE